MQGLPNDLVWVGSSSYLFSGYVPEECHGSHELLYSLMFKVQFLKFTSTLWIGSPLHAATCLRVSRLVSSFYRARPNIQNCYSLQDPPSLVLLW